MKKIKLLLSLALLFSFASSTFAQKYKPDTKEIFIGDGSDWTPYSKSDFSYFETDIDSIEEMVETWDAARLTWEKSTINISVYSKKERLLNERILRYIASVNGYADEAKTDVKYRGFSFDGTPKIVESKRTTSFWNDGLQDWKEVMTYETTFDFKGNKRYTINKQGFVGVLKEVSKNEFTYASDRVVSTRYFIKVGGEWEHRSTSYTMYGYGNGLISQFDQYDYTATGAGTATFRTRYTYTSFDEVDSMISYKYDTTAKEYIMNWHRVYSYDGNENLVSEISHVVSSGTRTNDYKVVYGYSAVGATETALASSSKVYPNPATGLVYVKSANPLSSIDIVDLRGKKIESFSFTQIGQGLDVSELARGVYFLRINMTNGQTSSKKLILE